MFGKFFLTLCFYVFSMTAWAGEADEKALFSLLIPQKTLYAEFQSQVRNERGVIVQKSNGKFYLKRPQQFRWETQIPEHTLVIADGKKVWNYDESLAQVTVASLDKIQKTPAILLSGSTEAIQKLFSIQKQKCELSACFLLKPKMKEAELEWLLMQFKEQHLSALIFKDKLGFKTDIIFRKNQANLALADHLFRFNPPEGVDVVNANER